MYFGSVFESSSRGDRDRCLDLDLDRDRVRVREWLLRLRRER